MEYQEQSLGGQIFSRIREDILSGEYAQGEELKEATLGKKLGVPSGQAPAPAAPQLSGGPGRLV